MQRGLAEGAQVFLDLEKLHAAYATGKLHRSAFLVSRLL